MSRQLSDLRLAVMMLDGLELKGRMMIVALGITTEGVKIPLGLWEGSTENATVATALLSNLVERHLDPEQGMLFVIDGSRALRKASRSVFGDVPVQRCIRTKNGTSCIISPNATAHRSRLGSVAPGRRPAITGRLTSCADSPTSSSTPVAMPTVNPDAFENKGRPPRMFKIVDMSSGAGVGSVGFWTKEWPDEQVYEVGWMVVPEFQGRGIVPATNGAWTCAPS
jgi:Transposase, Mutator family